MNRFKVEVFGEGYTATRFSLVADSMPVGEALLDLIQENLGQMTDAYDDFGALEPYELEPESEREDLRDSSTDRAWVVERPSWIDHDGTECNNTYLVKVTPT